MTAFLTPFSFALLWAVSSLALELPFAINLEAQSAAARRWGSCMSCPPLP